MIKFSAVTIPTFYSLSSPASSIFVARTQSFSSAARDLSLFPSSLRVTFSSSTILAHLPASIALPPPSPGAHAAFSFPDPVGCNALDTSALSSSTRARTTNRPSFKYFQKESILRKYPRRASPAAARAVPAEREGPKEPAIKYVCMDAFTKSPGPWRPRTGEYRRMRDENAATGG